LFYFSVISHVSVLLYLALNAESHNELTQKVLSELWIVVEHGHQTGKRDGVDVTAMRLASVMVWTSQYDNALTL